LISDAPLQPIVILISKFLERHSKVKRRGISVFSYSQALRQIKGLSKAYDSPGPLYREGLHAFGALHLLFYVHFALVKIKS